MVMMLIAETHRGNELHYLSDVVLEKAHFGQWNNNNNNNNNNHNRVSD